MLYAIYGNDTARKTRELAPIVFGFSKKKSADLEEITESNYSGLRLKEIASQVSLFGDSKIIVLDGILYSSEYSVSLREILGVLAKSENCFILREEKLLKAETTLVEKAGGNIIPCETKFEKPREWNVFPLADAVLQKDRIGAWRIFCEAMERDIPAEEIHGVLLWQLKMLVLMKKYPSASAGTLGISPYVFSKTKNALSKFDMPTLESMTDGLMNALYKTRKESGDTMIALEQYLLAQV